jgi:hypothetical protein
MVLKQAYNTRDCLGSREINQIEVNTTMVIVSDCYGHAQKEVWCVFLNAKASDSSQK